MVKKKRDSKAVREYRAQISKEIAKTKREYIKKRFKDVLEKDKIENSTDLYNLLKGMSAKSRELAAFAHVHYLMLLGYSPRDIVRRLEEKRKVKKVK